MRGPCCLTVQCLLLQKNECHYSAGPLSFKEGRKKKRRSQQCLLLFSITATPFPSKPFTKSVIRCNSMSARTVVNSWQAVYFRFVTLNFEIIN